MAAKTSTSKTTATKRTTKRPPAPESLQLSERVETTNVQATTVDMRGPSTDEIARRAFELYLARGKQHGRAQEDWLTAERELRERYSLS